jgi:hypothetical protein
MEMKPIKKEQKSMLAKLLASENLIVEHGKFTTASFDVKNRVLRLPIWKEMNGSLYDLLVLHEVGHALFTPEEGLHDACDYGKGFKSFLNVVEDARIERKIKVKFPGGRRSFTEGYSELMERDFFGVKKIDISKLGLIDKINLHYKAGSHLSIFFTDDEQVYIDRIDKAETWETVVEISKDLYEMAKDEAETDMSDHNYSNMLMDEEESEMEFSDEEDGSASNSAGEEQYSENNNDGDKSENNDSSPDSDTESLSGLEGGENVDFEPESFTDNSYRHNEAELVSDDAKPYRYINLPTNISLDSIVIDFPDLYENYRKLWSKDPVCFREGSSGEEQRSYSTELFKDFRNKNKKIVEYLAKEFEMKKAAREHSRAATANSGILSSEKLYTYKYNEHLFKKLTIIPDGKNHGLIMFVDWSASMSQNMKGTIEQMLILVMFCKRINIPFEVYAFSDHYYDGSVVNKGRDGYLIGKEKAKYGDICLREFNLLNLFSSNMKAKELHESYIYMMATAIYFNERACYSRFRDAVRVLIPNNMSLGGTPLNSALIMSFPIMRKFISRHQIDVINSIFLTDGDSHSCDTYRCGDGETEFFDPRKQNVILRDPISKKQISVPYNNRISKALTIALVAFQREVFNINIVNFFISTKMKYWDILGILQDSKKYGDPHECVVREELKKYRKNKYLIVPEMAGFNEMYLIAGGKNLEVQDRELEIADDASTAQVARAFKKFSTSKLEKRKLLSRFIDMIAA